MDIKKLDEYYTLKAAMKSLQEEEKAMRLEILEELFPTASEGTFNEVLGPYKIKGVFKVNTKFDAEVLEDNMDFLTKEEKRCIKWTPSLIKAKYTDLSEDETSGLFDDTLVSTPALPSLELKVEDV